MRRIESAPWFALRSWYVVPGLLALSAVSCGSDEHVDVPLAHSFELSFAWADEWDPNTVVPPDLMPLRLRIDDAGDTSAAIVSSVHGARAIDVRHEPNGRRVLTTSFETLWSPDDTGCASSDHTRFDELVVVPYDDDGDGEVDRLQGSARGVVRYSIDDGVIVTQAFEAKIAGTLDTTPPTLSLRNISQPQHVLDVLEVRADEPLEPGTTARLRAGSGELIELEPCCTDSAITRFRTPEGTLLPAGTSLTVETTPAPRDLAGNQAVQPSLRIDTPPDPGLFAEDGFEGPVAALLLGQAVVLPGAGTVAPITGSQSLFMHPLARTTMRIPVNPGDTRLVMSLRGLFSSERPYIDATVAIRAADGQSTSLDIGAWVAILAGVLEPITYYNWAFATQVVTLDRALPEDVAGEVYVDIRVGEGAGCPGPFQPLAGALVVDDLGVE